jgi:hypothetical protein
MSSVDERIVEMRFDNRQFESGVKDSVKSLNDLKNGLNLEQATRSLSNLERVARTFSLAGIASGIDSLVSRFSSLGIIGMTALQNITNSAINAGQRLVSSLTIEPVKMGLSEYETKMGAIQTILTNTQGGQRTVAEQGIKGIKQTSTAAVDAIQEANEKSVESLQKANDKKLKELQKLADEELDILEEKQEKESEALEESLDGEMAALEKNHEEKLALYQEEYMAKLKVIDQAKYERVKAVDDEIDSIKKLTAAEEEARKKSEENKK